MAKSVEVKASSVIASVIEKIAALNVGQEDPRTWEVIDVEP